MTFHCKNLVIRLLPVHPVLLLIALTALAGCTVQPVGPESAPQGETQPDATTSRAADSAAEETKTGEKDASPAPDSGSGSSGKGKAPAPKTRSTPAPESTAPTGIGETCDLEIDGTGNPSDIGYGNGKIVFIRGEQDGSSTDIYVMDADGWERLPNTSGGDTEPKWSPDGTRIAYVSDGGASMGDIFVMDADGHNRVKIANTLYNETGPAWSPDGKRIAFTSRVPMAANRDGEWDIFVMDADGSNQTNITNSPSNEFDPTWSPDGSWIAFTSDQDSTLDIHMMDTDGSGNTNLTNSPFKEYDPSWSPDAGKIAFSSTRDGTSDIHMMDTDGSGSIDPYTLPVRKTNLTYNSGSGPSSQPEWSPDGSRIVFSGKGPCGNSAIWVMDSDGNNRDLLWEFSDGNSYSPHWESEGSTAAAADVSELTTVTGRAMWNDEPLTGPGIEVVAVAEYNKEVWTPVATSSVDADGYFTIAFSGSVAHLIDVRGIDTDGIWVKTGHMGVGILVEPNPGEMVDIGNVNVPKYLTLLTPENNASTTSTPTFIWQAFPGAVKYHFTTVDNSTDKVVSSADVGGATEHVSEIPFNEKSKFRWRVHAETASGTEIAFSELYTFKVVSSDDLTTVTGRSMWYDQPVADVEIFLVNEGSNRATGTRNAVGSADADGWFAISFAGSVPQMLWVIGIDKDKFWGSGRPVEPDPGQTVNIGDVHIAKKMTLLTPERDASTITTPTFTWEAFPDAVNYHIDVFDKSTGEAVLRADTGSATEYTAETPFNVNTKYEWSVHAESASGIQIAYYSAFYFTPVAPTAPPPPSVPTPTPIP